MVDLESSKIQRSPSLESSTGILTGSQYGDVLNFIYDERVNRMNPLLGVVVYG